MIQLNAIFTEPYIIALLMCLLIRRPTHNFAVHLHWDYWYSVMS